MTPPQAYDSEALARLRTPSYTRPLSIRERILAQREPALLGTLHYPDVLLVRGVRLRWEDGVLLRDFPAVRVLRNPPKAEGPWSSRVWLLPVDKEATREMRARRREANLHRLGSSLNPKGRPWRYDAAFKEEK